jgi:hypothetical protein
MIREKWDELYKKKDSGSFYADEIEALEWADKVVKAADNLLKHRQHGGNKGDYAYSEYWFELDHAFGRKEEGAMGMYFCCRDCSWVQFSMREGHADEKCERPLNSCGSKNLVSLGSNPWKLITRVKELEEENKRLRNERDHYRTLWVTLG